MTCSGSTPTSTSPRKSSRPPEIVLGIDPGTTGMGYALLASGREATEMLASGIVRTPPGGTAAERLLAIAEAVDALIAAHAPVALALERLYFNKNARTAMSVSEARGVALLCAARARLAVAEYTPQEVKLSVTGSGAAAKKQIQHMVSALLRLAEPIGEDNVADAAAVALTYLRRARWDRVVSDASRPLDPGAASRVPD